MTTRRSPVVPGRRGVLIAEIGVLAAAVLADAVLQAWLHPRFGWIAGLLQPLVSCIGPAAALLVVLRRRFPGRLSVLAGCVIVSSLLSTVLVGAFVVTGPGRAGYPVTAEIVAAAVITGAVCRRSRVRTAVLLCAGSGAAMALGPVAGYGAGSRLALLAVPAALAWGGAIAVGLVLRDADRQRLGELARIRADERLQLARELHDLVAHQVSGIVVRAQAAQALARADTADTRDPLGVYAEIERAGAEALAATRQLVGMLRTEADGPAAILPGARLGELVRGAIDARSGQLDGTRVTVRDETGLMDAPMPAALALTVHRAVLEAMANVARHAPGATEVDVTVGADAGWLVIDIVNDGVDGQPKRQPASGYGLVGVDERAAALGGTVRVGPGADSRLWHVGLRLPWSGNGMIRAQQPEEA